MDQPVSSRPAAPSGPSWRRAATRLSTHGHVREDPYFWLRDRSNPLVLEYLRAENAYADAVMAHATPLRERLFREIKGRVKQTDTTVPYRRGEYFYYRRLEEGRQYAIDCRKQGSLDAPEEILLDANELAQAHAYFAIGSRELSPDHRLLAFAIDTTGGRIYTVCIKDLQTRQVLPVAIPLTSGNMAWARDNRTVFYVKLHPVTLRSYQVYRHTLGTQPEDDTLVYDEPDETYSVWVGTTKSQAYVLIGAWQTLTSECHYIPATHPEAPPRVVLPRRKGHEYDVCHLDDYFYIRTNDGARNFRVMRTPVDDTGRERWEEVVPSREDVLLEHVEPFRGHLVLEERHRGSVRLRVVPVGADAAREEPHVLEFDEPAYVARTAENPELESQVLRLTYTSLTTPPSVYDYDLTSRARRLLKRDEVLGDFQQEAYRAERLIATAPDGVEVPISILYRRDRRRPAGNPVLVYGYGSYGISVDPTFSAPLLSLIDRGFVYAIAHVRGGEDLGRPWYDQGRALNKKNTFTDFIACAEHLREAAVAAPGELYALGGSAGGLLMGAVINMRPDLFRGVVAHVPFVDVLTTMLDAKLPLTTGEYDEWGNPNEKDHYDYILSYSPYDNVERKGYPHLLVTAGLFDSQVQFWEPAKWVAKLRELKTDRHRLLLKTNMTAGHAGASGRYRRWRELAFEFAFLLDLAGVHD